MEERMIKTHLIVTDVHEEYNINWCGSITDADPVFNNDMPIFILISDNHRLELNTADVAYIEKCAKNIAVPHGREATTSASTRIYIKENGNKKTLLGVVTHNHVKQYAPMYDKVYYR